MRFLGIAVALLLALTGGPVLANGRADNIKGLDPALIRQIQTVLKKEGFLRGVPDGRFGATSQAAVRRFRVAHSIAGERDEGGLDLTYYLTPKLAKALLGITVDTRDSEVTEFSSEDQLRALEKFGLKRTKGYWSRYVDPDK